MTAQQKNIPALRFPEFKGEWHNVSLGNAIDSLESGVSVNSFDFPVENANEKGILKTSCISKGTFNPNENKTIIPEDVNRARLNPKANSILISRMNTPQLVGESGFVKKDYPYLFVPDRIWMALVNKAFSTKFISMVISSPKFMGVISNIATGTSNSMKNISKPAFLGLEMFHPSLPEQQKIADFLTAVDDRLQQLTQKKNLLEQYKKGMMQKLFSRELRFKDDKGKDFPEWEEKRIKDFAKVATGNTPPTNNAENYGNEYLFVSPADLGKSTFINNTEKKLSSRGFSLSRKFPKGSVLFTCIGSTIGKSGIASLELTSNQQINAILPNIKFNSAYVFYFLFMIASKIRLLAGVQAVPQINKTEFEKIKILFPNLAEQKKIGDFLTSIDDKINEVQTQIQQTQQYKKGLLQQMFC